MILTLNEIPFSPALMIFLTIIGCLILFIVIINNVSNPAADKIRHYFSLPLKSINVLQSLREKIEKTDFSFVNNLFIYSAGYTKKTAVSIFKFETEYLHNFLKNIEDFVLFLGLVSRKITDVNIKTCTSYILVFVVLFYFIFRAM